MANDVVIVARVIVTVTITIIIDNYYHNY